MTIEQEKEQAKLCVAWLATVNMHRREEMRNERDPDGKCWVEDDEWRDSVEDAKEEWLQHLLKEVGLAVERLHKEEVLQKLRVIIQPTFLLEEVQEHNTTHHLLHIVVENQRFER